MLSVKLQDGDDYTAPSNEFTPEDYDKFLIQIETIPTHKAPVTGAQIRLAFEFMEDTGLRVTEMLHVRKCDINFRTRILTVIHPKVEEKCKCSRWKFRDQYTRSMILDHADRTCEKCHGKGKWKKPQYTTITPRIIPKLSSYCDTLTSDADILWPTTRQSVWSWGKRAGLAAGIDMFTKKKEREIDGIYNHLFRVACAKRMMRDGKTDDYPSALQDCKMRHAFAKMGDRYTQVDINYLLKWENAQYSLITR